MFLMYKNQLLFKYCYIYKEKHSQLKHGITRRQTGNNHVINVTCDGELVLLKEN
jgi:hypothetical protein